MTDQADTPTTSLTHLVLFRHGIAVPHGTEGIADDDRPLTSQGIRKTRQVAGGLRPLLRKVDRIVTSPLPRAKKTAEIVADVLGLEDRLEVSEALIPTARPVDIREHVEARPESRVMLVGHNPSLSNLLSLLIAGHERPGLFELRKAGAAALRRSDEGSYHLDWFIRPRLARIAKRS